MSRSRTDHIALSWMAVTVAIWGERPTGMEQAGIVLMPAGLAVVTLAPSRAPRVR